MVEDLVNLVRPARDCNAKAQILGTAGIDQAFEFVQPTADVVHHHHCRLCRYEVIE
jgi:hypothetical protein